MGGSCSRQRSLSLETNARDTEEIPALNLSSRACHCATSNGPYRGHQGPYLVPRTDDHLSPLWPNADHWPYAPGLRSVTGKSWRKNNLLYLQSRIPVSSRILLYDLNHQTFYTIPYLSHIRTNATSTSPQPWIMYNQAWLICWGSERIYERHPPV